MKGRDGFQLRQCEYYADGSANIAWVGNKGALVPQIGVSEEIDKIRDSCQAQVCGAKSVNYITFADKKIQPFLEGTELCDYFLIDYLPQSGEVQVEKTCYPNIEAMIAVDDKSSTTTKMTVKVP